MPGPAHSERFGRARVAERSTRILVIASLGVLLAGASTPASAARIAHEAFGQEALGTEPAGSQSDPALQAEPDSTTGANRMGALLHSILALPQGPPESGMNDEGGESGNVGDLGPILRLIMTLLQSPSSSGQSDLSALIRSLDILQGSTATEEPAPDTATPGVLGVIAEAMTPELRKFFGATPSAGVLIVGIREHSRAMVSGLQVGDVVIDIDGNRVTSPEHFHAIAGAVLDSGNALTLGIVRERSERDIFIESTESGP